MLNAIDVMLSFLVTFVVGPVGLTSSMKDFVCDAPTKLESSHCWGIWKSTIHKFIALTLIIIAFKVCGSFVRKE